MNSERLETRRMNSERFETRRKNSYNEARRVPLNSEKGTERPRAYLVELQFEVLAHAVHLGELRALVLAVDVHGDVDLLEEVAKVILQCGVALLELLSSNLRNNVRH